MGVLPLPSEGVEKSLINVFQYDTVYHSATVLKGKVARAMLISYFKG